jgi:hypothetical protein
VLAVFAPLSNLILLYRGHHRLLHSRLFSVDMAGGMPVFRRDDGAILWDGRERP